MITNEQAIVITGSSTGIGKATALHLDRLGFKVFAGVRKETDAQVLKQEASNKLTPILLDVTDGNSIAAAVDTIARETGGELYGLVNNAGIAPAGPLECVPMAETRQLMEVNVLGVLAVTQAFLPLLRQSKGHIVNISSNAGLVATPGTSNYAASKFAVQAISDSLRLELRPFGIRVSLVIPGRVESAIWDKSAAYHEKLLETTPPDVMEYYKPLIDFSQKLLRDTTGISADEVARIVATALTAVKPKHRYLVGRDARKVANLARLPVWLRDWLIYRAIYK